LRVSALFYYPIKSCGGTALLEARLDARGLEGDRSLMVVDPAGRFITQRQRARLALVRPRLSRDVLTLEAPGMETLSLELVREGPSLEVEVWGDRCQAVDQGEAARRWLSEFLDRDCRLVGMAAGFVRPVGELGAQVGFADQYPLLVISEASLAELNARLPARLPMNRFRPNLVVAGCSPYAEDGWGRIRVGSLTLARAKPCARCVTTTIDQDTGVAGDEPLRTLATYRKMEDGGVAFGQNFVHLAEGTVRIDDEVELL